MGNTAYRFDPIDVDLIQIRSQMSAGQRLQAMLDAREMLVGLIRGRLRQHYPHLPDWELNLKVLEEIERAQSVRPGP
jgi:hypothetical protein